MLRIGRAGMAGAFMISLVACAGELPDPESLPGYPGPVENPMGELPDILRGKLPGSQKSKDLKPFTPTGNEAYDTWRTVFAQQAVNSGRDANVVWSVLQGLSPMPETSVATSFGANQAEFVKPIWDYVKSATSPARVQGGQDKLAALGPALSRIERSYAPPREILTAIWGMETSYGNIMGSFDSPRMLATMAYTGRRTKLGESQLMAVFDLLEEKIVTRDQLRTASWAGAVGQTQFMPATFLAYGRDGNGDNRIDMWNSSSDALASAANYLTESGWQKDQPWALEVTLPAGFDYALGDGQKRSVSYWRSKGLQVTDGRPAANSLKAELFLPAGSYGPAFLLFENFYVIRKYNNADSYALSIGLLADRISGRAELSRPWPTDIQLPGKTQIKQMQSGLNKLGYDAGPIDGLAGRQTRAALQRFQKSRGIIADGFATNAMVAQVQHAAAR